MILSLLLNILYEQLRFNEENQQDQINNFFLQFHFYISIKPFMQFTAPYKYF